MDTQHPLARTWWRHTRKAVEQGHPTDRLFAVVGVDGKHLIAWKCEDIGQGTKQVRHPAVPGESTPGYGIMDTELHDPFILQGDNGSEPTAAFKPDSFYERVR